MHAGFAIAPDAVRPTLGRGPGWPKPRGYSQGGLSRTSQAAAQRLQSSTLVRAMSAACETTCTLGDRAALRPWKGGTQGQEVYIFVEAVR